MLWGCGITKLGELIKSPRGAGRWALASAAPTGGSCWGWSFSLWVRFSISSVIAAPRNDKLTNDAIWRAHVGTSTQFIKGEEGPELIIYHELN